MSVGAIAPARRQCFFIVPVHMHRQDANELKKILHRKTKQKTNSFHLSISSCEKSQRETTKSYQNEDWDWNTNLFCYDNKYNNRGSMFSELQHRNVLNASALFQQLFTCTTNSLEVIDDWSSVKARGGMNKMVGSLLLWACVQGLMWRQLFERNYFPLFVDSTEVL